MSDGKYLGLRDGTITQFSGVSVSAGVDDAGALVALGADGKLDVGMIPLAGQFVFTQGVASASWVINHNLNRYPPVEVVDSSNRLVEGDVEYVSPNQVIVHFAAAFAGTAYVN